MVMLSGIYTLFQFVFSLAISCSFSSLCSLLMKNRTIKRDFDIRDLV